MKVKIRRANKNDLNKIYFLGINIKEFIVSKRRKFYEKNELKEWVKKSQDNIFLIVEYDKQIIGFLYAKLISNYWCMLDNIGIIDEFRSKGIGSMLLKKLYQILDKKRVCYLQALVGIEYKKTRKFWKKKGFKEGKKFIWVDKNLENDKTNKKIKNP